MRTISGELRKTSNHHELDFEGEIQILHIPLKTVIHLNFFWDNLHKSFNKYNTCEHKCVNAVYIEDKLW